MKLNFVRVGIVMLVCVVIPLVSGAALAQDSGPDVALIARYAGIPFERAEDGGFVLGDPDASLTVVEFSDFMCPHCQDYEETAEEFITKFVVTGEARFEYRMMPIVHPVYSSLTAQVAECADTLQAGMFWPAHALLFELAKAGQIDDNVAGVVASRLGLDADAMNTCLPDARQFEVDSDLASDAGIQGTPAIMVRQDGGDLEWLVSGGQTINRGAPPLSILEDFVRGDESITTTAPDRLLNDKLLHDTSLVSSEPCATPCWQGIIPGETTWDDAIAILEENEQYANLQVNTSASGSVQATWQHVDGQTCCQMISEDGSVVTAILLRTAPVMTLGEIVDQHGDPAYLTGSPISSRQAVVNLFFPDVPMIVYVFVAGPETGEISETSEVIGVLYLGAPTMEIILQNTGVYAWVGYESYKTYAESEFAEVE